MAKQLACNLTKVKQLYSRAGFIVPTILMCIEFEKVIPEMPNVVIDTSAAREYQGEVE